MTAELQPQQMHHCFHHDPLHLLQVANAEPLQKWQVEQFTKYWALFRDWLQRHIELVA